MGVLTAFLGLLLGGYLLGMGTAGTVFRERQRAYEDGAPEQLDRPALLPKPTFVRIPVRTR